MRRPIREIDRRWGFHVIVCVEGGVFMRRASAKNKVGEVNSDFPTPVRSIFKPMMRLRIVSEVRLGGAKTSSPRLSQK